MSTLWSLCLQSRQGRKIVKVSDTATTEELFQLATESFQTPIQAIKYGFPPKGLEKGSLPIKNVIQNQERLQVEFGTANKVASSKAKGKKKGKSIAKDEEEVSDTQTTNASRRSKRAAAQAATEAMPAVIKAQDEMMKKSSPTKKRPRSAVTSRPKTSKPKFGADVGDGRRLADGATIVNPKKARAKKNILQASGSSDMSEALLGALNNKGKMGSVLRKGMKNAVGKSYETTRAFSRLAAIQNQTYQLVVDNNDNGQNGKLAITYKGTVDKTIQIDTVDCIPRDILEAVIQGIHASNQDALRIENLALLSPRVLWSLVHVFPNTPDITDCYKELLPNLDWSFMRRRAQQLSEKALENLRQEQEAKGQASMDASKAQDAIQAVEHAMEHLHEHEKAERTSMLARAALARMQQQATDEEEWKLVTPNEIDRDELRECIQAAPPDNPETISSIITHLIKTCQIHNWRELANVPEEETTRLPAIADKFHNFGITADQISKWIDKAQEESVDEIMVEICDGNVDAVEALTEQARTGTAKDLANWRLIPEVLHSELKNGNNGEQPTIDQLAVWSKRAHDLLQEYEWLNWFATPVA